MTHEEWRENYKVILAEADKYNIWRRKAQIRLLRDIGPRIAALSTKFYMGCGFHYSMEQKFGRLIDYLALPWQPSGNHCNKIDKDMSYSIVNQIIFKELLRQVRKAEKSVKEIAAVPD